MRRDRSPVSLYLVTGSTPWQEERLATGHGNDDEDDNDDMDKRQD